MTFLTFFTRWKARATTPAGFLAIHFRYMLGGNPLGGQPKPSSNPKTLRCSLARGRPPLVQEEIHEHAGDAHVVPNWKRPAGPAPVTFEIAAKGQQECSRHQKRDRDRENDVREKHHVVHRRNRAFAAELGVHAAHENFVRDVTNEENRRNRAGSKHARAV